MTAAVERLLRDYYQLTPEEKAEFMGLLPDGDPSNEWWEAWQPEIERRLQRFDSGEGGTMDALDSVARIRARIDAHPG